MFPPPQPVVSLSLSFTHPSFVPNFFTLPLLFCLYFFRHTLVFSHTSCLFPPFPPSLFLFRVLWFPQLHVLCPCSASRDSHCASYSSYLRVKKKEREVQRANIVPLECWLGLKREGVRETFWQREERGWEQTVTVQILSVFHCCSSLSVSNVILKAWGTEMATWYHTICSTLNRLSYH